MRRSASESMTDSNSTAIAYIAVGSNILPDENVPAAVALLAEKLELMSISNFYRTRALHRPEQADYRNGVVAVRTALGPLEVCDEVLRPIEAQLKRKRSQDKYAARTVDLDLILYGDEVAREKGLYLPDPDLRERPFIAVPLLELAPDLVLPDDGTRLAELGAARRTRDLYLDESLTDALKERLLR